MLRRRPCLGALFFGQLTDRFGRKKLFMLTLGVYIAATVAGALSFAPWYFFLTRAITGAGIGGEYAAINSAIDELIPARVRGRVDLFINGSYWIGAAAAALAALLFLSTSIFAIDVGWRLAFGVGAVFGVLILLVRRNVPESPRWLFIHGREEEAERIVDSIEREVESETDERLEDMDQSITVRQRRTIPFSEIAKVAFSRYPKRTVLGLALFIGQAFLYNAFTFDLGTLLGEFFGVSSGSVPYYLALFGVSNFMGPFLLGRLFDTVGRRPMVSLCYLGSTGITVLLGALVAGGGLSKWGFMGLLLAAFFLASAGASSAYLTVSEIFPMETRALAVAFFLFGVEAAGKSLEDIAEPLSSQERAVGDAADGRRRHRLGPSSPGSSRGWPVSDRVVAVSVEREVEAVAAAVADEGSLERRELARRVGAARWGPGRFAAVLREAEAREGPPHGAQYLGAGVRRLTRRVRPPRDGEPSSSSAVVPPAL